MLFRDMVPPQPSTVSADATSIRVSTATRDQIAALSAAASLDYEDVIRAGLAALDASAFPSRGLLTVDLVRALDTLEVTDALLAQTNYLLAESMAGLFEGQLQHVAALMDEAKTALRPPSERKYS